MRANKIKNRVQINVFNIPILSYAKFSIWWSFWYDHWVEKSEPLAGVLGVFSHWFEIIFIRMFYAMNVSQIHNIVVYSSKHRFINIWDRKISYIHWGYYFRSALYDPIIILAWMWFFIQTYLMRKDNLVRHLANPFYTVHFVVDNYNLVLSTWLMYH